MDSGNSGVSRAFYTVKQLSALFGKSEDTIRRWKNEGIGREEDNIRLRAVEREYGGGRKNTRHLVFSREAVIDFVRSNPFLMDNAPELGKLMQAEDAWRDRPIPMPGDVNRLSGDERIEGITVATVVHGGDSAGQPTSVRNRRLRRPVPIEEQERADEEESLAEKIRRLREEAAFDSIWADEDEEEFYDAPERRVYREPWKNQMPKGDRKAGEREYQRRMKIVSFALDTLRERCVELEKERHELEKAMEELMESDVSSASSISQVLSQKCAELASQKDMLEEFIGVIEEEIRED